jgi:hypothetical protein
VVVDVEECEALDRIAQDDQKGVDKFKNLGEVEYVGPEK